MVIADCVIQHGINHSTNRQNQSVSLLSHGAMTVFYHTVRYRISKPITKENPMQTDPKFNCLLLCEDIFLIRSRSGAKFNFSIERKLERLWEESEKSGWKFSQFVTAAIEVLTVLDHRNKFKASVQPPQKLQHRKKLTELT